MTLKVARVATISYAFVHILGVLKDIEDHGIEMNLIASSGDYEKVLSEKLKSRFIPIEIPRKISILKDLKALWQLYLQFRKGEYDIVHSSTPKAGLLCAIAGKLAGVPVRIHTFTGQRWETLTGLKRYLLMSLDYLVGHLNSWSYADSPSQIERLREMGIVSKKKSSCLGLGSYGGIDVERFERVLNNRTDARTRLGFNDQDFVVVFLGRLCTDKGIPELLEALNIVHQDGATNVKLLLIGPTDEDLSSETKDKLNCKHIVLRGFQNIPENDLIAGNIFCLPSHREGFGTVVLEAAILGIPTIGTRIPGLSDSIEDNVTGYLVEKKNAKDIAKAILRLRNDGALTKKLGVNARERAIHEFSSHRISELLIKDYNLFLKV